MGSELKHFPAYQRCHYGIMGDKDLKLNMYRFIDTQVMEEWKQPLFLLPVSFKDAGTA